MAGTPAKFEVLLTEGAELDLEAIHDYISEFDCVANANYVLECFSSCLPCCPLAPRWSFSDPNADGSALTKRDAKRRGRHQNRLLVSAVHDSGFLERLVFLPNPCFSVLLLRVFTLILG